jgi:lipopolysaccharide/colanic/teichoic acid biosynthesis glycosyltransferase
VLKRVMDIFGCLALTPFLLPLCGILVLLIKFSSPGPAFFSHRRISKDGGFFSMWKFRTMCVNSDEVLEKYLASNPRALEEWTASHKLRHDPRVTRIGQILRRYSLDELPQFWNVFRGDMSLVGPRPIIAAEVGKYGHCFSCYCSVKSGVTGLWQVSGRSKVSYAERIALDCRYVREWSLLQDIKILFKTVSCVVDADGAF